LAASVVGLTAPAIGTLLVQRRLSLIGDGMGHLAFAGVALGVLANVTPLWGAFVAAALGALGLERLRMRGRLSGDLSMALVFYFGIALGAVVLSALGRLDAFAIGILFGSVYTVSTADLIVMVVLCVVEVLAIVVLYKELLAVALDEESARAAGLPVDGLNMLTVGMTALLVVAGMRAVGLLLISALLVVPVAASSRIAHSFRGAMLIAMGLGLASALVGLVVALAQGDVAPSGTIVLAALVFFGLSMLLGRRAFRRHPRRVPG
ncbi:MAG TPA: metal ABC transporter permease, partial [Actinomycetota bacterium]|nr:metal ABC transporter permease [Actinomycetota bacterium]